MLLGVGAVSAQQSVIMCDDNQRNIAVCMSDKKSQKLNWKELIWTCNAHGYNLVKVDIQRPLEEQGPITVFLHKLTDAIAAADNGDAQAWSTISRVEQHLSNHPEVVVIDPLHHVRILLNRNIYYTILQNEPSFKNQGIFTPNFAELTANLEHNKEILNQRGVTFPVVCKPTIAHGSKSAHEMMVIFNEKGLRECKPPCVVQSFVNHNAVLYKVYLVGNRYHICERPSLKNFTASEDLAPIFYTTGEVCKADSQSTLSILDPHDQSQFRMILNEERIKIIIRALRKRIGLLLAGFDVVIDNETGNHAVIDINVFPGYDTFPNFFEHLLESIDEMVDKRLNGCDSRKDFTGYVNGLINVGTGTTNGVSGMNLN